MSMMSGDEEDVLTVDMYGRAKGVTPVAPLPLIADYGIGFRFSDADLRHHRAEEGEE